jgi:O-antigen/teichoic acid export membrane protein
LSRSKLIADLVLTASSQIAQSATSFLVTLAFAQILSPFEFGVIAGIWLVWMLIMSFNRSVFTEQLLAQGVRHERSQGYGSFFVLWTTMLALCTAVYLFFAGALDLLPGVLYVAGFVGSDAIRYWFLAHTETQDGFGRYLLIRVEMVRALLAIAFFLISIVAAAPSSIIWISAIIGLLWPAVACLRLKRFPFEKALTYLRNKSRFEFLLALQYFLATGVAQLFPLMALPMFGPTAFGSMRLAQSSLSPLALLGTAFQPAMIKALANQRDRHSLIRRLVMAVTICAAAALLVGAGAFGAVILTGKYWLPVGQLSAVQDLAMPIIAALAFVLIAQPGGALIRVMRLGAISLTGQVAGLLGGAVAIGVVIAGGGGLIEFAWAVALGTISTVVSTYALLIPWLKNPGRGRRARR